MAFYSGAATSLALILGALVSVESKDNEQTRRGIWRGQIPTNAYLSDDAALEHSHYPTEANEENFLITPDPEIRSRIITRININKENNNEIRDEEIHEAVGSAVLKAFDVEPLRTNHLLTRRRPNLEEISWALHNSFDFLRNYIILPYEDVAVILRMSAPSVLDTCAIATVETAYTGGKVLYWLRCSIYEGSEHTSAIIRMLSVMVSCYDIIDYPDSNIIDYLNYAYDSRSLIAAYAEHPDRTQTLFLIPKSVFDKRELRHARFKMAGALIPYGIIGELRADEVRDLTGLQLPSEVCAVALPPKGSAVPHPRIVLEARNWNKEILKWGGMSDYLAEIAAPEAPWLSASYKVHQAQSAAIKYARLLPQSRGDLMRAFHLDRQLAEHIQSTTEQPGWDLHSPPPSEGEASEQHEPVNAPSGVSSSEPNVPEEMETAAATASEEMVPAEWDTGRAGKGATDIRFPNSLSELPNWVRRRLYYSLEIAPRAVREIKKFRHPQPERIARALELLAGPRLAMFRGDRSSSQAFYKGLEALRLRDGFSGAEQLSGRTGRDYVLSHRGRNCLLDRHLASNSSGFNDPKLIRIYYFYDTCSDKIIVGWLPTHLQTSKS